MKNLQAYEQYFADKKLPKFRIKQVLQAICEQGIIDYEEITVLPKDLREQLNKDLPILSIKPVFHVVSKKKDTEKALFEIEGGLKVEAVLMKYQDGRNTICISSQAGCQMGCKFCATGTMKFGRNLTYEEIFDQALYFNHLLSKKGEKISNVVYMGMGEPFMNYQNVIESAYQLHHPQYLNLGARRITISTSGVVDGIDKFTQEPIPFNLALSLHAPNQELREKIMPIARRWNLETLLNSIKNYIQTTKRRVSYEYVMLNDINDTVEIAQQLGKLAQGTLTHINLIPYNATDIEGISGSLKQRIFNFQKILQDYGVNATVRSTMGEDIAAACGQLANKN